MSLVGDLLGMKKETLDCIKGKGKKYQTWFDTNESLRFCTSDDNCPYKTYMQMMTFRKCEYPECVLGKENR